METQRKRALTSRKPLSDCTNSHARTSSQSSSSTPSEALKPTKPNPSLSSAFKKSATKCNSGTTTRSSADASNSSPSSLIPPILSTPSRSLKIPSRAGIVDLDVSEPISVFYSRRRTSEKRKNKEKSVANPVSKTPITKISNIREKSDGVEGLDLPKAKSLAVPCRKKQRNVSYEQEVSKDAVLQDFIEKQRAYFKEIDEFKLPEEEVESIDELD